ncbi:unnamed protein product [Lactuca saligna]|uniref:Uncharacterized protein n=1 Tax=Lactuca saligna TaxID=75948 RepID=A0AA35VS21_LACSI|nr:unnamed protein product [Lactuca saligna]
MCGFLLKVHQNFFYNDKLIARIHALNYGISLVLVIYLLGIHPLSLRELQEELGLTLPNVAFELLFVFLQQSVTNNDNFINNEFDDVYLVTIVSPIPLEAFTLSVMNMKFLLLSISPLRSISRPLLKKILCMFRTV